MDKKQRINLAYAVAAVLLWLAFLNWFENWRHVEPIPYSEFVQLLDEGKITDVVVGPERIVGKFTQPQPDGRTSFITYRVDPPLADMLTQHGIQYDGEVESTFFRNLMSWVLPIGIFYLIWMFFFRRFAEKQGLGGLMSVGKSKAKVYVETDTKVTFDDVAGVDEAKEELKEIVAFLRDPKTYGRLGAHIPKGILLVGPPGTGKTLLARAVAGEAGVPFFSISGSEFVEMFVGVGAARVRDLFAQAASTKPCIIFIDELDALGRARGPGITGGYDEKEQTLNQLLSELDGFDPSEGIVLLAATNRPEILDPALLRAGRFDRQVLVDRPERSGRLAILEVHIKKIWQLGADVDLDHLAALTPGFTGADLANLVNEAALLATRREADAVTMADFTNAIERIVAGLEKKSRLLNPHERAVVAHHEMGHALVAAALPGMDPVHKVSIIPRGVGALGYTIQRPTEDRFLQTTTELRNRMVVLMGGRAAEQLIFGEISTGAADDLAKVTDIARRMVTRFGMADSVGQVVYEEDRQAFLGNDFYGTAHPKDYAEATGREIDLAVRDLVADAYTQASQILERRRDELTAGATKLLERETLTADEFPAMKPSGTVLSS
ncbi:ATP-dependent zinc metalloprotease FtsH [Halomonas sp. MCCC 1A17488]|uniref:ATP-dependent zinc metalloprotease FtsH n=1 Tax=unclassified Halomonas TaxID=2609666 RepID=UPI0018D23877|nr:MULTISPECIES: ATP-dependent zinc metalloprotease FtsH [unclassified Halomonas]MCE8016150.1 ATP-dependent zinc metalloprotease FtsH [Halomonas sp. MCCC 1A17488]MCG3239483.1 ATP-dependent zinc metalloprotease FtsH [Halomonas sp. MCCC 1A17488]QPP50593.1 ATP-dependent zinc metalloprotease FtsH [Halomonas sp. SS10-MC5]